MDSSAQDQNQNPQPPLKEVSLDAEGLDPAEVLLEPNVLVQIPVPDAKVFNNIAEYYSRTFAKKNEKRTEETLARQLTAVEGSSARFAHIQKTEEDTTSSLGNREMTAKRPGNRRGPKRDTRSVLDKMEEQSRGPLAILYRALNSETAIRVFVRRRKLCSLQTERFSWISGHLLAFDKHFNLALENAVEEYDHQHQKQGKSVTVKIRKCTKQLFVRGDNIVLVSSKYEGEEDLPNHH